jgi:hypothetical protein
MRRVLTERARAIVGIAILVAVALATQAGVRWH